MTDWHVHVGGYQNNAYYRYEYVFKALKNNGVDICWYAYLTPKYDDAENSLTFVDYSVQQNLQAVEFARSIGLNANVLCWIDPALIDDNCDSFEFLFAKMNYQGIAVHPFHEWNDRKLDLVFQYAFIHNIPLFIHTGVSKNDSPLRFEKHIRKYQQLEVHLAHCKDAKSMVYLFDKFPNVFGDTAFCPPENYECICNAGFQDRMLFGTDFPITHWYHHYGEEVGEPTLDDLYLDYKDTLQEMSWYKF